jgi:hypothetical protein
MRLLDIPRRSEKEDIQPMSNRNIDARQRLGWSRASTDESIGVASTAASGICLSWGNYSSQFVLGLVWDI